jgi:hypothetical protein
MKKAAVFGVLVLVSSGAMAQPKPIKDAMHKIFEDLETAYNKGDSDAVISYLNPSNYSWKMLDGKSLNYGDAKKEIKSELGSIQSGKWHVDLQSAMGSGPVALVVVQYSFKGMMIDDSKHAYPAELTSTERQTWIRGANGWKQASDEILSAKFRSDGTSAIANIKTSDKPDTAGPAGTPGPQSKPD